jgi:FKBP-type peptidyl-prolyl cis-trans isomerase
MAAMDRRIVTLISASALLAVIVAVVLIAGGSDDSSSSADLTDTTVKPTIEAPDDPAPTELVINDIVEGEGAAAKDGDRVSVQYVGALYDTGQEFDASWDRGEPFELTLGGGTVIQGWDQGLIGMKAGGRRELIIPADLGYGAQGSPPSIPADAALIFVVDMLSIN